MIKSLSILRNSFVVFSGNEFLKFSRATFFYILPNNIQPDIKQNPTIDIAQVKATRKATK